VVAAGPEQHGAHPQELGRDYVAVNAVADHDAIDRADAKVIAGAQKQAHGGFAQAVRPGHLAVVEVAPDPAGVELCDDALERTSACGLTAPPPPRGRLSGGGGALQRRAACRHPGVEHAYLPGQPGPALAGASVRGTTDRVWTSRCALSTATRRPHGSRGALPVTVVTGGITPQRF
jgi:hypothetical protein